MSKGRTVLLQLASKSPRRRALLEQIGVPFEPVDVYINELRREGESAEALVIRLAEEKAQAGYQTMPKCPTLGSDTVVVCDGCVFGKPEDFSDFQCMMGVLSGRSHQVLSAVSIYDGERQESRLCTSNVTFNTLTDAQINGYWQTKEPHDKAGGYGIQGYAAVFIADLQGSFSGVMGLPLNETAALLDIFNIPYWQTSI